MYIKSIIDKDNVFLANKMKNAPNKFSPYHVYNVKSLDFFGQSFAIVDNEYKIFVSYITYYKYNKGNEEFKTNVLFIVKNIKNNNIYIKKYVVKMNELYLNEDYILDLYKDKKNNILKTDIKKSLYNLHSYDFKKAYLFKHALKNNYTKTFAILYPHILNENYSLMNKPNLIKIKESIIPFCSLTSDNENLLLDLIDNQYSLVNNILQENSLYKQLKMILPFANRETLQLLKKVIEVDNNLIELNNIDAYEKLDSLPLNLLSMFKNTQNLNLFLKNTHCYKAYTVDNVGLSLLKTSDLSFYTDRLPLFFKNQNKFEKECVRFLQEENKKIEKNSVKELKYVEEMIEEYIESICKGQDIENHDEICDCEEKKNDLIVNETPLYVGSFEDFYMILKDIKELYFSFLDLKSKTNNKKTIDYIDYILSIQYESIQQLHDELATSITLVESEKILFDIQKNLNIIYENEYFKLRPILDSKELVRVGYEMKNCVSAYQSKILNKDTVIYIIENKKEKQYVGCLEYDVNENAIIQAKSKYNEKIKNKNILKIIKDFCTNHHIDIKTYDL